ncbi:hypothetical protein BB561_000063 [Smittium simulii]|uniref:Dicer-like protein 1 n=1 Tax=Smittium simulii TaxID=133385 RepID=A0A2T9Z0T6_9FUNG|nr:hypothetical protein BB561_000063 [Smittium simulii]
MLQDIIDEQNLSICENVNSVEIDLDQLSKNLIPRDFQKELLVKAKNSNSLIVLKTGSGKTLIATMLIEYAHLAQKNILSSQNSISKTTTDFKTILFVCNTNVLAHQQAEFIRSNTFRTVNYCNSKQNIAGKNFDGWQKLWKSADVHILTSQILLNCLRCGFISMKNISLMIFDECHHMRKNSSYNRIMKEFYELTETDLRPQIFGMTASPVNANEVVMQALERLEASADSTMLTADVPNVYNNSDNLNLIYLNYNIQLNTKPTILKNIFFNKLSFFLQKDAAYSIRPFKQTIGFIENELGHYIVESTLCYILIYLENVINSIKTQIDCQNDISDANNPLSLSYSQMIQIKALIQDISSYTLWISVSQSVKKKFEEQSALFSYFYMYGKNSKNLESNHSQSTTSQKLKWNDIKDNLSPKVNKLIEYLVSLNYNCNTDKNLIADSSEKFTIIVFVNRRITAFVLSMLISELEETSFLTCEPFIKTTTTENIVLNSLCYGFYLKSNYNYTSQTAVMERFRMGKTNILIATQIAEEGLDIPSCNIVVRFDPPPTLINFIQSRGRARDMNAQYIMMTVSEYQTHKEYDYFELFGCKLDISTNRTAEFYNKLMLMEQLMNHRIKFSKKNISDINQNKPSKNKDLLKLVYCLRGNGVDGILNDGLEIESRINLDSETKIKLNNIRTELIHGLRLYSIDQIYFEVTKTGAKITSQSSTSLLNSYAQLLLPGQKSVDAIVYDTVPLTNLKYMATVSFPSSCPIKRINGPICIGPKIAKKSTSFYAAVILHYFNIFDEHLVPVKISNKFLLDPHNVKLNDSYKNFQNVLEGKNITKHISIKSRANAEIGNSVSTDSKGRDTDFAWKKNFIKHFLFNSSFLSNEHFSIANENNTKDSGNLSYLEVYVYSINLNYKMDIRTQQNQYECSQVDMDSFNNTGQSSPNDCYGFSIIFFTKQPLPENILIPLYIQKDSLPFFYKLDPLATTQEKIFDQTESGLNNFSHQKTSLQGTEFLATSNQNKIKLDKKLWDVSVRFTGALFSILSDKKHILPASKMSYAFALPTKGLSKILAKCYSKENNADFAVNLINAQKLKSHVTSFCNLPKDLPVISVDDFDFIAMKNIYAEPDRLTHYDSKNWEKLLYENCFMSDIDTSFLCFYNGFLPNCTLGSKLTDIIDAICSFTTKQEPETTPTADNNLKSDSKTTLENTENDNSNLNTTNLELLKVKELLDEHFQDIRLIDIFLQNSMIYSDQCYKELSLSPIFSVSKLRHAFDFLKSSSNDSMDTYKNYLIHTDDKLLIKIQSQFNVNKGIKENNADFSYYKGMTNFFNHLKTIIAIPSMINLLPWSHREIQLLSVLPSFLFRLDSMLTQFELISQLDLSFFLNSQKYFNINIDQQANEKKYLLYSKFNDKDAYMNFYSDNEVVGK